MPMMTMELAHAVWWERSKYFLPVLSNFQGFFPRSRLLNYVKQELLALHSAVSSNSALAAPFWSAKCPPISLAIFSRPVLLSKFLSLIESVTGAIEVTKFKTYVRKLFLYQSIKFCVLFLAVFHKFLLHFTIFSLNLPSKVVIFCCPVPADHISKDTVTVTCDRVTESSPYNKPRRPRGGVEV